MRKQQIDHNHLVVIQGYGYVTRIREVTPPGARSYLACEVNLWHCAYRTIRFYCVISGKAKKIVRAHFTDPSGRVANPENTTVIARMRLVGISALSFVESEEVRLRSILDSFDRLQIDGSIIDLEPETKGPAEQVSDDQKPVEQWGQGSMGPGRYWPGFTTELRDEYLEHGCIMLESLHPQFEARKSFLRKMDFEYCAMQEAWVKASDIEWPAEALVDSMSLDLRNLDFRNTEDSPITLEATIDDTIRIYLNGQFLGDVGTRLDPATGFYWIVFLENDPRGHLEIRDPYAIVNETRRWAETHPCPSVEAFALPG